MRKKKRFRAAVIYQIYPRSYKDTSENGIGDLKGIISKLDYLNWLGIDVIWLSPHYPSPMEDFGYDVSDFVNVHEIFGTLADFDLLIQEAHERDMQIIIDFVANHSSDKHPWFQESKSDRHNSKRDWYVWKDPKSNGNPPSNWPCITGGSAWGYDETTQQYFLHSFLPCQPDLNWDNQELREAMYNVLRFWLDRGVDGFRIDMISWISKDPKFRDDPLNPSFDSETDYHYNKYIHKYSRDGPRLFEYLEGMRKVLDDYGENKYLVGELDYYLTDKQIAKYFDHGIHIPAFFRLIYIPWTRQSIETNLKSFLHNQPIYANFQLGNHDQSRVATRLGEQQARVAAVMLLTLPRTLFIYYGEEIGMKDGIISAEVMQDPWEKTEPGQGRDPERTPMQWNNELHAGFSDGKHPWLPVSEDYQTLNVEYQKQESKSMLNLYRRLIKLRKQHPVLIDGKISFMNHQFSNCFCYTRTLGQKKFGIYLNMVDTPVTVEFSDLEGSEIILSSYLDRKEIIGSIKLSLRGNEACLVHLRKQ